MWEEFDDVCRECRRGGASVSNNELDLCSIIIATTRKAGRW